MWGSSLAAKNAKYALRHASESGFRLPQGFGLCSNRHILASGGRVTWSGSARRGSLDGKNREYANLFGVNSGQYERNLQVVEGPEERDVVKFIY